MRVIGTLDHLLEKNDFTIEPRKGIFHGNAVLSKRPCKRCNRENCHQCFHGAECSVNTVIVDLRSEVNSITQPESNWQGRWSQDSIQNHKDND